MPQRRTIAAILAALAFWFFVVQGGPAHAQQGTLTLACKGTITGFRDKPESKSMGLIVNFTSRTVQGFEGGDFPAQIEGVNDTTISFYGSQPSLSLSITGSIDRVTGAVYATLFRTDGTDPSPVIYELQCKPTERMF